MLSAISGEILGPDLLIIGLIVLVLFGGSQLPKLARSLGSAKKEFERGLAEGHEDAAPEKPEKEDAEPEK